MVAPHSDDTRHWTEDETELFTGDELVYCGGCCGQHLAKDACDAEMSKDDGTMEKYGASCDAWIDCFVQQCQVG